MCLHKGDNEASDGVIWPEVQGEQANDQLWIWEDSTKALIWKSGTSWYIVNTPFELEKEF
jgi:hypothetical protein